MKFKVRIVSNKTRKLIVENIEMRSNIDTELGNNKLQQIKQLCYLGTPITELLNGGNKKS